MSVDAEAIEEAAKLSSHAAGTLNGMLARRKFSREAMRRAAEEMRQAEIIMRRVVGEDS